MNRIHGVVTGIVTAINDDGLVRLKFPWLSDTNQSPWARIATMMAGKQRGSWFMPEVDDEVLVAFDHGDINHPYVVGFLWNGIDKPPNDGISPKVRRLRTVGKHVIEFDDRAGQGRILIQTAGDQQIELDDRAGQSHILIQTAGGQQIELKDTPATITIKTKLGNEITISDAPPGISIKAETAPVQISCLKADVSAKSMLQVTAPIAQFSGIVMAQLVQAQAVVSAAYNPGVPGNLFGL